MKLQYIISAMMLFICVKGFAQSNPRMENENYMYTVFQDNFDTPNLDRSQWNVSHDGKKDCGIWVDGANTVNQTNSCLNLSIISSPGYTITDWLGDIYTADYISGEVTTDSAFHYGSFECRAKYAHQRGSWPAFWAIGGDGIPCEQGGGAGDEIDISEFWSYTFCQKPGSNPPYTELMKLENNCHRYYNPGYCDGDSHFHHWYNASMGSSMDNNFHIYKCVWTPDKIDFYMDNVLKNTVLVADYSQYFPFRPLHVKLSQQVACLDCGTIVAPQTSSFDYVKVKKFFLVPEITLSTNVVCSTGTATIDVDLAVTNISWQLTPSNLFSGGTTGTGKVATITRAAGANGKGKITYTYQMPSVPSNETFTAEKEVLVGTQVPGTISVQMDAPIHRFTATIDPVPTATTYNWYLNGVLDNTYHGTEAILNRVSPYCGGSYSVDVKAYNPCGWSTLKHITVIEPTCFYGMIISPNPTESESTIELYSESGVAISLDEEWELEVYDQQQSLKEKKTKIKGIQTKLNTSGWNDGVYFIRAHFGDEWIRDKIMVKH